MSFFFEPNWVKAQNQQPSSPDSLVLFVVAKLGPNSSGSHYPLAVVRRDGGLISLDAIQGRDVLAAIHGTITVFSDPANHIGILSELSLAAQFYKDPNNALPQTELSNLAPWQRHSIASTQNNHGFHEFPFISTCLMLGVGFDRERGVGMSVLHSPLGTVFRDTNIEYAMAVVDITDLHAIRYGIIAFRTTVMIHLSYLPVEDIDNDWGPDPPGQRELKLEENRTRDPLSAAAYMDKFQFEPCDDLVGKLNSIGLIDTSALERIWPPTLFSPFPPLQYFLANTKLKMSTCLMSTERIDISPTLLSQLGSTLNSKHLLRDHLQERCHNIGHLHSTGQPLGLAFSNESHLNLAPFTKLSAVAIAAALEATTTTSPVQPTSISLNIDTLLDPPTTIIDVLTAYPTLKALYLLQEPTRTSDDPSRTFFLALVSHPSNILARLATAKLHISGAYSAALRKEIFLYSSLVYQPPILMNPVLHIFTRHHGAQIAPQNIQNNISPDSEPSTTSTDSSFYLGDALLRPERFAAGFLLYLRSLLTSTYTYPPGHPPSESLLCGFACSPPDLVSDQKARMEISPPLWKTDKDRDINRDLTLDLVQGSWSVLVDRRVWIDVGNTGEEGKSKGKSWTPDMKTTFVRYAFVRIKKLGGIHYVRTGDDGWKKKPSIPIPSSTRHNVKTLLLKNGWKRGGTGGKEKDKDTGNNMFVKEGEIEVTGLRGFLEATVSASGLLVDPRIVDRRLDEFVKEMEGWPGQGSLPGGMEKLAVLEEGEAREMLGDFLARWMRRT